MKTDLRKGRLLESGFKILEIVDLKELDSVGILAVHEKSRAEVFHIYNDDEENLFSFAFTTPSRDSTGVSHILEHIVLSGGSKNYPIKNAFNILAQGSLNTYLNAMTMSGSTIYPASSLNEHDYFNLMSVYGDSIFRPLLSEWTFMQEGHHLYFDERGELKVNGVVYNEVKDAYPTIDSYADRWITKSLFLDTHFDHEFGGDPDHIPDLSFNDLKKFHRLHYTPANCKIFLAGNIPTEKQLNFLNERFFSSLPPGKKVEGLPKIKRRESPASYTVPCPLITEKKSTVLLSWLCTDITDHYENMALSILIMAIKNHNGSPLNKALIDSGLGEDISPSSGHRVEYREVSFTAGLRGVSQRNREKVKNLIMNELERLEREGLPKEEVETALIRAEFFFREIRRSGGPFSLNWMTKVYNSWLNGAEPWNTLLFLPAFNEVKRRLKEDPRFLEKMIRRYFLENNHRAFIVIEPKKGFKEEKEAASALKLKEREAALRTEDREKIVKKVAKLQEYHQEKSTPDTHEIIPHLKRDDLEQVISIQRKRLIDVHGLPMIFHPIYTNGISYVTMLFPLDIFPIDDYMWMPFFSSIAVSMGLPGMDYTLVSSLLAKTVGRFSSNAGCFSLLNETAPIIEFPGGPFDIRGRDWVSFSFRALDEKIGPAIDLAYRIITEADFSDLKRLKDLVLELKNDLSSDIAYSGAHYAVQFSKRLFSRSLLIDSLWDGFDQNIFLHKLISLDIKEISEKLTSIQSRIKKAGVLINLVGDIPINKFKKSAKILSSFGPPMPRNELYPDYESLLSLSAFKPGKAEVFTSPSLEVSSASISIKSTKYGSPLNGAEFILSHILSTGALWDEVRVKGGAYVVEVFSEYVNNHFTFLTSNDPNPIKSLQKFSSIIGDPTYYKNDSLSEDALTKAIIGTYSVVKQPLSPAVKGYDNFIRFMWGISDKQRLKNIKNLINTTRDQVYAVHEHLAESIRTAHESGLTYPIIVAGREQAKKAAKELGVEVRHLLI